MLRLTTGDKISAACFYGLDKQKPVTSHPHNYTQTLSSVTAIRNFHILQENICLFVFMRLFQSVVSIRFFFCVREIVFNVDQKLWIIKDIATTTYLAGNSYGPKRMARPPPGDRMRGAAK